MIAGSILPLLALVSIPAPAQQEGNSQESRVIIVDGEEGKRFWTAVAGTAKPPVYPRGLMIAGVSGCVTVGYFIESDGSTSGFRTLSATTTAGVPRMRKASLQHFAASGAASASLIRYEPGPDNPDRLRGFAATYYTFHADENEASSPCRIDDLKAFLAERASKQSGTTISSP